MLVKQLQLKKPYFFVKKVSKSNKNKLIISYFIEN